MRRISIEFLSLLYLNAIKLYKPIQLVGIKYYDFVLANSQID